MGLPGRRAGIHARLGAQRVQGLKSLGVFRAGKQRKHFLQQHRILRRRGLALFQARDAAQRVPAQGPLPPAGGKHRQQRLKKRQA